MARQAVGPCPQALCILWLKRGFVVEKQNLRFFNQKTSFQPQNLGRAATSGRDPSARVSAAPRRLRARADDFGGVVRGVRGHRRLPFESSANHRHEGLSWRGRGPVCFPSGNAIRTETAIRCLDGSLWSSGALCPDRDRGSAAPHWNRQRHPRTGSRQLHQPDVGSGPRSGWARQLRRPRPVGPRRLRVVDAAGADRAACLQAAQFDRPVAQLCRLIRRVRRATVADRRHNGGHFWTQRLGEAIGESDRRDTCQARAM